ncbi:vomeronasal type-2 receptor 26-like [Pelodytes ibericus]
MDTLHSTFCRRAGKRSETYNPALACDLQLRHTFENYEYVQDGDIIIGGVLTVNNNMIEELLGPSPREYINVLVFLFAIEQINTNTNLLPNLTLGYHFYDSCSVPSKAVKSVLQILSGPRKTVPNYSCMDHNNLAGFIGDHHSLTTVPMAQILGVYGHVQISYGATDYSLGDRRIYPYYFPMLQNYHTHYKMIAQVMKHFGWTWVGIIISDDHTGETESQVLIKYLNVYGICVSFIEKAKLYIKALVKLKHIQRSSAGIIILCGSFSMDIVEVLQTFSHIFYNKTFILPPSWESNYFLTDIFVNAFNGSLSIELYPLMLPNTGTFFDDVHPSKFPNDKLLADLWTIHYRCSSSNADKNAFYSSLYKLPLHNCTGEKHVLCAKNHLKIGVTPRVFYSLLLMAEALHLLHFDQREKSELKDMENYNYRHKSILYIHSVIKVEGDKVPLSVSLVIIDVFIDQELHNFLKKIKLFSPKEGKALTYKTRGFESQYILINWIRFSNKTPCGRIVGKFTDGNPEGQQLNIYAQSIRWRNKNNQVILKISITKDPKKFTPRECFNFQKDIKEMLFNPSIEFPYCATNILYTTLNAPYKIPRSRCSETCLPGYRKVLKPGLQTCCYDCVLCSEGEISNTSDSDSCITCLDHEWPNERKDWCVPKVLEFLSYTNEVIAVVSSFTSIVFCLLTVVILLIFIASRNTPIVKANNRNLSFLLLVSIMLSFLCVFLFLGCPVDMTCMLRQTSFGIFFSTAVSSILGKTIMIYIAFKATKPGSAWANWVNLRVPNSIVFICSSIQVIVSIIWLAVSPPYQELDTHSYKGKIIVQCNEGSVIAFYTIMGYMGFLAAVSFFIAFLARTLPDSFNEAKNITFSMLVFCSVWIAMIPAYLSTKGKDMVAVEIFSILASSAGLLACIFFPKCYIIVFRPGMNTKTYLLGKINKLISR